MCAWQSQAESRPAARSGVYRYLAFVVKDGLIRVPKRVLKFPFSSRKLLILGKKRVLSTRFRQENPLAFPPSPPASPTVTKRKVPLEALRAEGAAPCPVFYLNYNFNLSEPWTDTIGSALKAYKDASAYNIVLPNDMGLAMKEMLARIAKHPNS
jgi:hypothetical protein